MTTQPQPAVTVLPPLPTRRNAELFLLGFATVITTVALLIVEANQEQGLSWDLASYTLAYMALFGAAHLTIRRFAPYADPLLLPVVARRSGSAAAGSWWGTSAAPSPSRAARSGRSRCPGCPTAGPQRSARVLTDACH